LTAARLRPAVIIVALALVCGFLLRVQHMSPLDKARTIAQSRHYD